MGGTSGRAESIASLQWKLRSGGSPRSPERASFGALPFRSLDRDLRTRAPVKRPWRDARARVRRPGQDECRRLGSGRGACQACQAAKDTWSSLAELAVSRAEPAPTLGAGRTMVNVLGDAVGAAVVHHLNPSVAASAAVAGPDHAVAGGGEDGD